MYRHPPRSPLFPYTTLFRSVVVALDDVQVTRRVEAELVRHVERGLRGRAAIAGVATLAVARDAGHGLRSEVESADRSEEHTSELQSRQYLVCRLLLEKKNTP